MAELKTQRTKASVAKFIAGIKDEESRRDCRVLLKMMQEATGERPAMWGASIVGFGDYQYHYASGRAGGWFLAGFSPRKQNLTVYLMAGPKRFGPLLKRLGKHKVSGGSCLYIKRLSDVDLDVLRELIEGSVWAMRARAAD